MIFDGNCRFCRVWIERWRAVTGDKVEYLPFQDPAVAAQRRRQDEIAEAYQPWIVLDDGRARKTVDLRQPHVGLYIPTMIWSELVDFASGTIAVVLASRPYDESEYIRDYDEFVRASTVSSADESSHESARAAPRGWS